MKMTLRHQRRPAPPLRPPDGRTEITVQEGLTEGFIIDRDDGLLRRRNLKWRRCCGAQLLFDDGSERMCMKNSEGEKLSEIGEWPEGFSAWAYQCERHTNGAHHIAHRGAFIFWEISRDGGLSWVFGGPLSAEDLEELQVHDADRQLELCTPHDYRGAGSDGWPTPDEWGAGVADHVHEWKDYEAFSIETLMKYNASSQGIAEAIALRDEGQKLVQDMKLVASGEYGEDTQEAKAAWTKVRTAVECASPTLHKNMEMKLVSSKKISEMTVQGQAQESMHFLKSAVKHATLQRRLLEAMEGTDTNSLSAGEEKTRRYLNRSDEDMLQAAIGLTTAMEAEQTEADMVEDEEGDWAHDASNVLEGDARHGGVGTISTHASRRQERLDADAGVGMNAGAISGDATEVAQDRSDTTATETEIQSLLNITTREEHEPLAAEVEFEMGDEVDLQLNRGTAFYAVAFGRDGHGIYGVWDDVKTQGVVTQKGAKSQVQRIKISKDRPHRTEHMRFRTRLQAEQYLVRYGVYPVGGLFPTGFGTFSAGATTLDPPQFVMSTPPLSPVAPADSATTNPLVAAATEALRAETGSSASSTSATVVNDQQSVATASPATESDDGSQYVKPFGPVTRDGMRSAAEHFHWPITETSRAESEEAKEEMRPADAGGQERFYFHAVVDTEAGYAIIYDGLTVKESHTVSCTLLEAEDLEEAQAHLRSEGAIPEQGLNPLIGFQVNTRYKLGVKPSARTEDAESKDSTTQGLCVMDAELAKALQMLEAEEEEERVRAETIAATRERNKALKELHARTALLNERRKKNREEEARLEEEQALLESGRGAGVGAGAEASVSATAVAVPQVEATKVHVVDTGSSQQAKQLEELKLQMQQMQQAYTELRKRNTNRTEVTSTMTGGSPADLDEKLRTNPPVPVAVQAADMSEQTTQAVQALTAQLTGLQMQITQEISASQAERDDTDHAGRERNGNDQPAAGGRTQSPAANRAMNGTRHGYARDYAYDRDTGSRRNEAGVFHMQAELRQEMIELGDRFAGGEGCNLFNMANAKIHQVNDTIHLTAMIHGKGHEFEHNPRRNKKIYESMTEESFKGWTEGVEVMDREFHKKYAELNSGDGEFGWRPGHVHDAHLNFGTSTVAMRLTNDHYLVQAMDKFVKESIDSGVPKENVMKYMRVHFEKLADAEKKCFFSPNLVLYRQYMLNKAFVDERCVVGKEMWDCGMYDKVVTADTKNMSRALQREVSTMVTNMMPGGGASPAGAGRGTGRVVAGRGTGKIMEWGTDLEVFRSAETNLAGQPYMNRKGGVYWKSVCDKCEADGASTFHHHPLRCKATHGHDCILPGKEPEKNGVRTWYVRGNKTATLEDDGTVTIA